MLANVILVSTSLNGGFITEDGAVQNAGDFISFLNISQGKVFYNPPAQKHSAPTDTSPSCRPR